jgi:hypothetical protein
VFPLRTIIPYCPITCQILFQVWHIPPINTKLYLY